MKSHVLTVLVILFAIGCFLVGYTFPIASITIILFIAISSAVVYAYWFVYRWVNSYFGENS